MPATKYSDFKGTAPDGLICGARLFCGKGIGVNEVYVVEVDPATGGILLSVSPAIDWGVPTLCPRVASMIGSFVELPSPHATNPLGITATALQKSVANDGRALDINMWAYSETSSSYIREPLQSITIAQQTLATTTKVGAKRTLAVDLGWDGTAHREKLVSPAGNTQVAGIVREDYLAMSVAYPLATREVYSYWSDAAMSAKICDITINYTDASKEYISTMVRT